jgi:hypothetical protein
MKEVGGDWREVRREVRRKATGEKRKARSERRGLRDETRAVTNTRSRGAGMACKGKTGDACGGLAEMCLQREGGGGGDAARGGGGLQKRRWEVPQRKSWDFQDTKCCQGRLRNQKSWREEERRSSNRGKKAGALVKFKDALWSSGALQCYE